MRTGLGKTALILKGTIKYATVASRGQGSTLVKTFDTPYRRY
jgi:hypothetical protein